MNPPRPVVFIYRTDGSGRLDNAAMMRAAVKGTLSSRQIRAKAERAARKAAKAAEGPKPRRRASPARESPNDLV